MEVFWVIAGVIGLYLLYAKTIAFNVDTHRLGVVLLLISIGGLVYGS